MAKAHLVYSQAADFLLCHRMAEEARELSEVSFTRALIPWGRYLHDLITSPKSKCFIPSYWGLGFQHMTFSGGHKHLFYRKYSGMDLASQRVLQQRLEHDPLFLLLLILSCLPPIPNERIIYPREWLNIHWISMDIRAPRTKDQWRRRDGIYNNAENNTNM